MPAQSSLLATAAIGSSLMATAAGASLADIDHVVLFMQENRAFDHYFGTLAGVRGFSDPNAQLNSGIPVWQQKVNSSAFLNPWHINYLGGDWVNATQCMVAGSNGWTANHLAYAGGSNNLWAVDNTPYSWGHYTRDDIPLHYAIHDSWVTADMYQEAVVSSTSPNRATWASGTINVTGGSPYIDNTETPGCESPHLNCYPLTWPTLAESIQDAGISWNTFQDADNFDDNPLAWFEKYQDAKKNSELYERGFKGETLDTFYARAANGTLPTISYIIGPAQLSEHPPYSPHDGSWLQQQVINAVTKSPLYKNTVLMISYDETGGWGDHVIPFHSPANTPGEYIEDPYSGLGQVFTGPGFRTPFSIISPWTRGSHVFTEHADHNSQILFLEKWQAAKGKTITAPAMEPWRRSHMSDLLSAFDFANPDYSIPELPTAPKPHMDASGNWDGSDYCEAKYPSRQPPVPYNGASKGSVATDKVASLSENGFKTMRGKLTEGRYLVLEMGGQALSLDYFGSRIVGAAATAKHDSKAQRWVAHVQKVGTDQFQFSSAKNGKYIDANGKLVTKGGAYFTATYKPGKGYAFQGDRGTYLSLGPFGLAVMQHRPAYFDLYSVTYDN